MTTPPADGPFGQGRAPRPIGTSGALTELEQAHATAFGARIRQMRQDLGLTQRQVATLAGRHPGSLPGVELGRGRSTRQAVEALADAFAELYGVDATALRAEFVALAGPSITTTARPKPSHAERQALRAQQARRARGGRAARRLADRITRPPDPEPEDPDAT